MRILWIMFGGLAVTLGAAGVIVPLLPTTPLLLLAGWCFARSSPTLHHWLVSHPRLGPPIQDWRSHGAIRPRAKCIAMIAILASFLTSVVLGVGGAVLIIQGVVLVAVSLFILTRPNGDRGCSEM